MCLVWLFFVYLLFNHLLAYIYFTYLLTHISTHPPTYLHTYVFDCLLVGWFVCCVFVFLFSLFLFLFVYFLFVYYLANKCLQQSYDIYSCNSN